eukprot:TRINITY_DN58293_c0_g1_i1.p1 TRINITY_DN58293_c0_g1~~TRINITY_DN58293_c0_g1_i1.p1  ORF type:complete len:263 (+),score=47.14 TRINITY_DN58293_c0_g1_i1:55-843(+)
MAEWKEGDWECPDCGKQVFASRETCLFCEKAASGKTRERREGDWDCPDCGRLVFASKDSCIFCARQGQPRGGDSSGGGSLGDAFKLLQKHSPAFNEAWRAYADLYSEGWYDAGRWKHETLVEFADYIASAVQTSLHEDGLMNEPKQETTSAVRSTKRSAPVDDVTPNAKVAKVTDGSAAGQEDSKPAAPKKLTMKKAFADEIRRLNASGALSVPLRPGAIAVALAQLDQEAGLSIFASLDAQKDEIEDPNQFVRDQAAEVGQ